MRQGCSIEGPPCSYDGSAFRCFSGVKLAVRIEATGQIISVAHQMTGTYFLSESVEIGLAMGGIIPNPENPDKPNASEVIVKLTVPRQFVQDLRLGEVLNLLITDGPIPPTPTRFERPDT